MGEGARRGLPLTAGRTDGNSWDGGGPDLLATTGQATAEADRPADGTLPRTGFLAGRNGLGATMTEQR